MTKKKEKRPKTKEQRTKNAYCKSEPKSQN